MTTHDDDDLRGRFRALSKHDRAAAPALTSGDINAWRSNLLLHSRRQWSAGMVAGLTAGAVGMLTLGLVLGASTGYASAEVIIKERGDTPLPAPPTLAVLRNIPPLMFSCGNAPRIALTPAPLPQQGIPIIDLPAPTAKTSVSQGGVLGVRQVSNGNIIVNDAGSRQVKIFDSTLALVSIARDSVNGTPTSYGSRREPMIQYLGDSSIAVDLDAGSILIWGPTAQVARAAAPVGVDSRATMEMLYGLTGSQSKGVDEKGRILYQTNKRSDPMMGVERVKIPESSYVIRVDLALRRADTVATIKSAGTTQLLGRVGDGPVRFFTEPVPLTDGWAQLTDGTLAIVRGRDYHIDWVHPDGKITATPKLPFDWKRLTDEDKKAIIDSIKNVTASRNALITRPASAVPPASGDAQPGMRRQQAPSEPRPQFLMEYVDPDLKDVFDYVPPLRIGAVQPDADGNVWILPTTSAQSKNGELVYDVANPNGDFHRVRLPAGRSIAGFAKGGIVFLLSGDKSTGFYIEKTRVPLKSTSR